ncbi:MAG: hypothetical protein PW735_12805 [Acidobacteriaceae bacterium]|nr:hypothetical protein [Acidobacteriaceae bacterium]
MTTGSSLDKGVSLQGKLHGGSQPVSGARVYLLAANTAGYPTTSTNASVSLLTSATGSTADSIGYYVTSDASGSFSITGDYSCSSGQQVYLLALGGDPGLGTENTHIGLATVLGDCPSSGNFLATIPSLYVDEVTTVAAAYALSGFAVDATHVGAPSASHSIALTGIRNAFASFSLLADNGTGQAKSTTGAGNGLVPQSEINTLANILSSCVNSTGDTSTTDSNCSTLFTNTTSTGLSTGTQPTDTFTAAMNIAHNPAANIDNLCNLQPGIGAPYAPVLSCSSSALPNDFTVSIRYPEAGGSSLTDLAVDSTGDVFVTSSGGYLAHYAAGSGYTETRQTLGGSLNSVAIGTNAIYVSDSSDNQIYVTSSSASTPTVFSTKNPSATATTPAGLSLSADQTKLYVCDTSSPGGVQLYGTDGTLTSESTGYFNQPMKTAVDTSGNVWAANYNNGTVGEMTSTGGTVSGEPSSGRSFPYSNGGSGVAIDQAGLVWMTGSVGGAAGQISPTGSDISGTSSTYRYTSGDSGQYYPYGVSIDGASHAWIANELHSSVQAISETGATAAAISPKGGFQPSNPDASTIAAIAVDNSGNVWAIGKHLFEFVGAATPVVTPVVASLNSPYTTAAAKP